MVELRKKPAASPFGGAGNSNPFGVSGVFDMVDRLSNFASNPNLRPASNSIGGMQPLNLPSLAPGQPTDAQRQAQIKSLHDQTPGPIGATDSYGNQAQQTGPDAWQPHQYPQAPGAPAAQPNWNLDISQPLAASKTFGEHGQKFFDPTESMKWHQQNGQAFLRPDANQTLWEQTQAAGPTMNNALTEYSAFGARRPDIASDPGFASYYDQAEKRLAQTMNRQLGARGMFGSTMGADQLGLSISDLRADQAKNEAGYNLKRMEEQRLWDTLGGALARNADLSSKEGLDTKSTIANNASDSEIERLKASREAATAADTSTNASRIAGMTAAGNAGQEDLLRYQTAFDTTHKATDSFQSLLGDNYDKLMSGDMSLVDAIQSALTAGRASSANYDASREGKFLNEILTAVNIGQGGVKAATGAKDLLAKG